MGTNDNPLTIESLDRVINWLKPQPFLNNDYGRMSRPCDRCGIVIGFRPWLAMTRETLVNFEEQIPDTLCDQAHIIISEHMPTQMIFTSERLNLTP